MKTPMKTPMKKVELSGRVYFCSRRYQLERLIDAGLDMINVIPNHNNTARTIYVFKLSNKLINALNAIDPDREYVWVK